MENLKLRMENLFEGVKLLGEKFVSINEANYSKKSWTVHFFLGAKKNIPHVDLYPRLSIRKSIIKKALKLFKFYSN